MRRLIKTLRCERGELYGVIDSRRILLARCEPRIEIYEDSYDIKTIGIQSYRVKKRHAALVLYAESEFTRKIDVNFLRIVVRFDLSADIQRIDGVFENMLFANLIPDGLEINGDWSFDIEGPPELIKKLLTM